MSAVAEVWIPDSDPMFSLVIDDSGGVSLFNMSEELAIATLADWWRHHRIRYRAWSLARARRASLHLVPTDGVAEHE